MNPFPPELDVNSAISPVLAYQLVTDTLPADLQEQPRFVLWNYECVNGQYKKIPRIPGKPREYANASNPSTWGEYGEAMRSVMNGVAEGIGFVLGDGFVGVDLQECIDPTKAKDASDAAKEIVRQLDSYAEISPSGRGIKIIMRGEIPPGRRRKAGVHFYGSGHYFALTGQHIASTPLSIEERSALLADLHERLFAEGFESGDRDLTQDGLALELGDIWRDTARFVAHWGRWLFYGGQRWLMDEQLEHMTRSRGFLRDKAETVEKWAEGRAAKMGAKDGEKLRTWAKTTGVSLRSAQTVAQVVGLARSNSEQVASVAQWDSDPWALGTPKGVVDLRTGELRSARPEDYITKSCAVAPASQGTVASLWHKFLSRITDNDEEIQLYLQRFVGYALTGDTREHAFAFGHGKGANGKSVFLATIKGLMGDYACSIPTEMLVVSKNERHPTELARLRGARLAIGNETEQGTRWAESRIKSLTGGDPIAARFMREDFFEFQPSFKLFVVGNHRPSLRGVDEAMRRRLHFVPFGVTIPADERDPLLTEKLRAEYPAILRWAIDGCLAWQEQGLNPPPGILSATGQYFEAEDSFSQWMEECVERDPQAFCPAGSLFTSWKTWAERAGEFTGSQKKFSQTMAEVGFSPKKSGGVRGFGGVRINPSTAMQSDLLEPWQR